MGIVAYILVTGSNSYVSHAILFISLPLGTFVCFNLFGPHNSYISQIINIVWSQTLWLLWSCQPCKLCHIFPIVTFCQQDSKTLVQS